MNKIYKVAAVAAVVLTGFSSCIEEVTPQTGYVTEEQAAKAPNSFESFVAGLTNGLCGSFVYSPLNEYPWDYGYPSFFLTRDVMGQDIALDNDGDWYQTWYTCGTALGPHYAVCQLPMTYFYGWIKDCNTVISMYKSLSNPREVETQGAGIAYALRAMFYTDIAQMYGTKAYTADPEALTSPLRTDENTSITHVARATNKDMFDFIIRDLDKAEEYLEGYVRSDVFTPDVSVVYGLKARAYLIMGEWEKAEYYANKAQEGYTMMTDAEYTDRANGFNTPNGAWMFGCTFKSTDANITNNDGDSSWGSQMIIEVVGSGCGYAANYGYPKRMDAHLFSTIPATDVRRKVFVDPAIDEMSEEDQLTALAEYSDVPSGILFTASKSAQKTVGCLSVKFRPKNGEHNDQYKGFTVAVPMMRVEEMMLIEAEAAGMQEEARGQALLEAFAKKRDPNYTYGTHQEKYYSTSTTPLQDEIWWQRRVELWGEGFSMYDIKRQQRGIIRNYAGTNHVETYRWNMQETPQWMTHCFVQTESNYNNLLVPNPTPSHEAVDDPEYEW